MSIVHTIIVIVAPASVSANILLLPYEIRPVLVGLRLPSIGEVLSSSLSADLWYWFGYNSRLVQKVAALFAWRSTCQVLTFLFWTLQMRLLSRLVCVSEWQL